MKYLIFLLFFGVSTAYSQGKLSDKDFYHAKILYVDLIDSQDYKDMMLNLKEFQSKLPPEGRDLQFTNPEAEKNYILENLEKTSFKDKEEVESYLKKRDDLALKVTINHSEFYSLFTKCDAAQIMEILKLDPEFSDD